MKLVFLCSHNMMNHIIWYNQTFDSLFSPLGVSVSSFLIQKSSWHFNWDFMNFSLFVLPVLLSSSVNVNFECRLNGWPGFLECSLGFELVICKSQFADQIYLFADRFKHFLWNLQINTFLLLEFLLWGKPQSFSLHFKLATFLGI